MARNRRPGATYREFSNNILGYPIGGPYIPWQTGYNGTNAWVGWDSFMARGYTY